MSRLQKFSPWLRRAVLLALGTFVLAGCTVVPLRSLWALRKVDFMSFDPAQLRAAVRLPQAMGLPQEAVAIDIKLTRGGSTETQVRRLWLRPVPAPATGWPGADRPGTQWTMLALDDADQRRLTELRALAAGWKAASPGGDAKNKLELSLDSKACLRGGGAPDERVRLSAWLHWAADPGWLVLVDDAPLSALLPSDTTPIPACAA